MTYFYWAFLGDSPHDLKKNASSPYHGGRLKWVHQGLVFYLNLLRSIPVARQSERSSFWFLQECFTYTRRHYLMEQLHCCYFCVEVLEDRKGLSFFMISLSSFLDEYKYFGSTVESLLKFSSMEGELRRQKLLTSLTYITDDPSHILRSVLQWLQSSC